MWTAVIAYVLWGISFYCVSWVLYEVWVWLSRWLDKECPHRWSWPRRIHDEDIQICSECGRRRRSLIQF